MFSGSFVAIVTPMRADGTLDLEAWERLLEFHIAAGTSGVVVGGTTGESATLTDEELRTLVVRALARCAGRISVIAGCGTSSTATTAERARWLGALGVAGLLVVTPAYNKPTQRGLQLHFEAVAAAASVPLILYNVPGRTAVDMQPETVAALVATPRIAGIKEAVADVGRIRRLRELCGADFCILSGDDPTACEATLAGAQGVISVTANVVPAAMSKMIAAARAGQRDTALALDAPLRSLHERLFVESNPIPVKWAVARMGYAGTAIRLPLTPLSTHLHGTVTDALLTAGVRIS